MGETVGRRRTKLEIITELYELTREMQERRSNAEFLVLSVEKRQSLLDEYEQNRRANEEPPPSLETEAEMKRLAKEVISMDAAITKALEEHKNAARRDLANIRQTMSGYQSHRKPTAGSIMDYKE